MRPLEGNNDEVGNSEGADDNDGLDDGLDDADIEGDVDVVGANDMDGDVVGEGVGHLPPNNSDMFSEPKSLPSITRMSL